MAHYWVSWVAINYTTDGYPLDLKTGKRDVPDLCEAVNFLTEVSRSYDTLQGQIYMETENCHKNVLSFDKLMPGQTDYSTERLDVPL